MTAAQEALHLPLWQIAILIVATLVVMGMLKKILSFVIIVAVFAIGFGVVDFQSQKPYFRLQPPMQADQVDNVDDVSAEDIKQDGVLSELAEKSQN